MSIFTMVLPADLRNYKVLYKFLIGVSIVALLSAYITEYVMKLPPCFLCMYQRYCYFLLIIFSAIGIAKMENKQIVCLIAITIFAACLIAGYHAGVERGIFRASAHCSSQVKITDDLSVSEIKDMLYDKPVASCERAALKFIGLSMAEWNLLLNLWLLAILFSMWKTGFKNHAKA